MKNPKIDGPCEVIQGYAADAPALTEKYESILAADHLRPVVQFLDRHFGRVLDIGAGAGRDAAWLAARGCRVVAVEPVAAFRKFGQQVHGTAGIEWIDDALPDLPRIMSRREVFDIVLLSAVWHHLDLLDRKHAMERLGALVAEGGVLVMSLRNGPCAPTRKGYAVNVDEVTDMAKDVGLLQVFVNTVQAVQKDNREAGVTWDWLVFRAGPQEN